MQSQITCIFLKKKNMNTFVGTFNTYFAKLRYLYILIEFKQVCKVNEYIITTTDKLVSFKKKVVIWKNRAKDGNFEMFSSKHENCLKQLTSIILKHLYITTLEEKN